MKDIITIFYSPLAQVYRAASIADSLNDLQNFVNDLIKTVEQVEQGEAFPFYLAPLPFTCFKASEQDPHRTVQIFIDLVQRHEQSFYHFVHKVHSKGEGLFDDLMRWVELFLTLVREGLGEPISLEFLLPHTGKERADILAEVDKVALYHYKLKVIYEEKLRRRFGRAQVSNGQENDADAEDEATQALVNGVVGEISFGELVQGDAIDLAAEETDEEESSDEYSSSDYESGSSEESEESSEEIISDKNKTSTIVRPTPPLRSLTIASSSRASLVSQPPSVPRKRSMSLKNIGSKNFSLSSLSLKRNQDTPPPVPSLSASLKSPRPTNSKPPTPSSMTPNHAETMPPSSKSSLAPSLKHSPPPQQQQHSKKKTPAETLQPPELHHIPQLLPVFVEVVCFCMLPSLIILTLFLDETSFAFERETQDIYMTTRLKLNQSINCSISF